MGTRRSGRVLGRDAAGTLDAACFGLGFASGLGFDFTRFVPSDEWLAVYQHRVFKLYLTRCLRRYDCVLVARKITAFKLRLGASICIGRAQARCAILSLWLRAGVFCGCHAMVYQRHGQFIVRQLGGRIVDCRYRTADYIARQYLFDFKRGLEFLGASHQRRRTLAEFFSRCGVVARFIRFEYIGCATAQRLRLVVLAAGIAVVSRDFAPR